KAAALQGRDPVVRLPAPPLFFLGPSFFLYWISLLFRIGSDGWLLKPSALARSVDTGLSQVYHDIENQSLGPAGEGVRRCVIVTTPGCVRRRAAPGPGLGSGGLGGDAGRVGAPAG